VTSPVNVLLGILTLVVSFHDLLQDRRDKQRLASEMEAARAVQQVLVPEITDGVVEARDESGQLFGFERTAALSARPAEEVMRTAQAFGQEDDITVVTLARVPVPAQLTAELAGGATV
jgi:serine phosphatase RsbU (regulator of sigma subunit)